MVARLRETHVAAVLCFVLDILRINSVIGEQSDPCNKYSLLSDNYRNVNSPEDSVVQKDECDNFMDPGWYAFLVQNQASMIPTECTQVMSCGSPTPFHVQMIDDGTQGEGLPLGEENNALLCGSGIVNGALDCCVESTGIKIKRCSETLVVYYISPFKNCPRTFCALKIGEVMSADRRGLNGSEYTTTPPTTTTTVSTPPTTSTASIQPTKSTVSTPPTKSTASTPPTITPYSTPSVTIHATWTLTSPANSTEATTTYQVSTQETMSITTDHSPPISRTLRQSLDSSSTSIAAPPASSQTSLHPSPPSSPPSSPTTLPDVATSPIPESSAGATDSGPVPHPQASSTSPLPGSSPPPSAAWSSPPLSPSSLSADSSPSLSSSLSLLSSQSVSSSSPYVPSSVPSSTSPPLSSSASGLPSHQPSFTAVNSTGGPPNDSSSTAETPVNVADLSTLAASAAGNASDEVSSDRGPTTAAALSSAATTTPASSSADDNASVGATVSQGDARAVTVAASDDTSPPDKAVVTATTTTTASPSTASSVMAAMTRTSSGWTTPRAGPDEGPRSDQTVCFVVRGDYKASTLQWIKTKVSSAPFTPRTDVIFSKPRKKHQLTCVGMNITNPLTNDTFPASHVVAVLKNISIAENFQSAHAGLSLEMHEASCQNQCYEAKATSLSLYETNKPLFVALISIALLAMVALVLLALFLRWRKQGSWVVSVDQDHEDCENGASHNTLAVESPMTDSQIQQGEEKMAAAGEATLSMNGHRPPTPACDIPLADDDDGWVVPLEQATKL